MAIKLSHSSQNKFQTCPKSWELRYKEKIVSIYKGSALFFGSAMDEALNFMLINKDKKDIDLIAESIRVFDIHWEQQKDNQYQLIDLPKNEFIIYSKYDFDADLLEKEDWRELFQMTSNPLQFRSAIEAKLYPKKGSEEKPVEWSDLESEERMFWNFASWLAIKRKAKLLIKAYHEQILPNIKEVIAIQKEVKLSDGAETEITGFVDAIVRLQDDRVAVMDNKTSSMEYTENSVETSPQLALYQSILNIKAESGTDEWTTPIDVCAYAVLSKKLDKEITKVCKTCGFKGEGSHKTCNNEIEGKRCGGEWEKTKKFTVSTQFIVDIVPDIVQDMVLSNAEAISGCIQSGHFPRNFNSCGGLYGTPCEYRNLCWNNSSKNLVKLDEKK